MGGRVVHARRGERASYTDLVSPLAASCAVADVVDGLVAIHPFERMYFADLDAIAGRGDHADALAGVRARHPGLELWIDAGIRDLRDYTAWAHRRLGRIVVGTESMRDRSILEIDRDPANPPVLSLDWRADEALGLPELFADAALWPDDVVVMTLARVGAGHGPDWDRLAAVRDRAGARRVYAAGGVRDTGDLAALRARGIAGALVATALHSGAIAPEELARFEADRP